MRTSFEPEPGLIQRVRAGYLSYTLVLRVHLRQEYAQITLVWGILYFTNPPDERTVYHGVTGQVYCDARLGESEEYVLGEPKDARMRVPDKLTTSICFLCTKRHGDEEERYTHRGTGFFVSIPSEKFKDQVGFAYLVTARHNIVKASQEGSDLYVRVNTKDGATYIKIVDEWYYPDSDAIDVAVLPFSGRTGLNFTATALPLAMFATNEVVKKYFIGIGEDLFMAGLFTSRHGRRKNLPILRTGIIAAMPEEPLIDADTGLPYYAYLAEVRSIGGLSGSPVYALVEPWHTEGKVTLKRGSLPEWSQRKHFLLGVLRGHWDYKKQKDASADYDDNELDAVNMGIATVTPIQEVHSILFSEPLVQRRRKIEAELEKENAPVPD